MAETKDIVEVRNETPLDIEVNFLGPRILKPLEVVKFERSGVQDGTFSVPALRGFFLRLQQAMMPPAVTVDLATVARGQEPDPLSAEEFMEMLPALREDASSLRLLRVSNETNHVAEVWLLDRTGDRRISSITPGETWEHPYQPRLLWHFRTPAGLTLGAFCQSIQDWGRKEPAQVKLTTAYLDAWQVYQQRPAQTGT